MSELIDRSARHREDPGIARLTGVLGFEHVSRCQRDLGIQRRRTGPTLA